MKRTLHCLLGVGLAALLAGSVQARSFTHSEVYTLNGVVGSTVQTSDGGTIAMNWTAPDAGQEFRCDPPVGADIDVVTLSYSPIPPPANDTFSAPNSDFTIDITITDVMTAASATFSFTGYVQAVLAPGQASTQIIMTGIQSQSQDIGGVPYTVSFASADVPGGQPGTNNNIGAITYHVECIPEPGTMALLGAGLLPLVGFIRRRK